jgi:hypothetical protein
MLDREIADAPRGIEHARADERIGRTGVETARAAAAPICLERRIHWEHHIDHERAQKEERAELRIDEHRVLAEPAEPGPTRQVAFKQRA